MTGHYISGETSVDDSLSLDALSDEFRILKSGAKRIAIIGTQNLPITHQQIVEVISHSLIMSRHTVVTSGGSHGVNEAVIRGGMRADENLLEVILPQTKTEQPEDIQNLLSDAKYIEEHPERTHLSLAEAGALCYREIVDSCHQLICFLYHDSQTLQKTIEYATIHHKINTIFYLD